MQAIQYICMMPLTVGLSDNAMDMDRRVSNLKEPAFKLKSLSQHNFDAWIPDNYYQYDNRPTVQPRPIINMTVVML